MQKITLMKSEDLNFSLRLFTYKFAELCKRKHIPKCWDTVFK